MDIVVRASVIFFFIFVVLRALGKREIAELTVFELVLVMVMGDLVQQGITQEDTSVVGATLAVSTIGVCIALTSYAPFRWRGIRALFEGMPAVVVQDGNLLRDVMHAERLTEDEVLEAAREQGVGDLAEVRFGILEADGRFTFIRFGSGGAEESQGTEKHRA